MDLILLQPGNPEVVFGSGDSNSFSTGGSLIDKLGLSDDVAKNFGQCIELVSVHQGMKQQMTTDVSNSARTSGRPVITEFTCVKYVDKSSVKFYENCLSAKPIDNKGNPPTRIYILRNSGGKTENILTFELRDTMISEIQFQSHPDDMPTEQFKLSFTEIIWTYTVQNTDTSSAGNKVSGWSIARNRYIGQFTE
jgi:type VI secretion system secreted protein Hcp